MWKVIYFIDIEDKLITNSGIPYLSKYPDPFSNVAIFPVDWPLVMYKFFGYDNDVEYHNKSMHYDLSLEKLYITQYGLLRLCTTVAMGSTITNWWKIIRYCVKRYNYDTFIGIR